MARFRHRHLLVLLVVATFVPTSVMASYTLTCASYGNRYRYCSGNTNGQVRLVERLSGYGCYQGRDWGYDNNGVWVSNGCSARFEVGGGGGHNNDAGNAVAVVAGLAILGAIIASADKDNRPSAPDHPQYSGVPPWAVGSFYGQDPYSRAWQTLAIDPNGGVARYVNGYPPVYGNFSNGAIYFGGQGMAVQPSGGGLSIGGAFFRRQ